MNKLYLIPAPLGDNDPSEVLPAPVLARACSLKTFVVEEVRTARRFLSRYGLKGHIEELDFHTLNEHTTAAEIAGLAELFRNSDVGLITEAGLPAVADPGAALVALCHEKGIPVVPLVGPSSLMMALMASGLNGQCFAFRGYLSAKTDERRSQIKTLEKESRSRKESEILIETPYRNDSLFADFLAGLSPATRLCVAADISLETEMIRTMSIERWRKVKDFQIGKRPCVFIILA